MTSGFALRARLVFREQRLIFDYWQNCANVRSMPARSDIDPCKMRDFLPQISLIDISTSMGDATIRLAGSRLREVYGIELTGMRLEEVEWGEKRTYWRDVYNKILARGTPLAGSVSAPLKSREHLTLHWLRMPLSDDGVNVNKVLCHDIAVPHGTHPVNIDAGRTHRLAATG